MNDLVHRWTMRTAATWIAIVISTAGVWIAIWAARGEKKAEDTEDGRLTPKRRAPLPRPGQNLER